jgi:hypothetical protein
MKKAGPAPWLKNQIGIRCSESDFDSALESALVVRASAAVLAAAAAVDTEDVSVMNGRRKGEREPLETGRDWFERQMVVAWTRLRLRRKACVAED